MNHGAKARPTVRRFIRIDHYGLIVNVPRLDGNEILQKGRYQTLQDGRIAVQHELIVHPDLIVLMYN